MASSLDTVHFICDQAGLGTRLAFRKMFGEYAIYVDGKVVALVCDDQLFLKPTAEGKAYLGPMPEAPPYPGIRPFPLLSALLDEPERLATALTITAAALPMPKPKVKVRAKAKAKAEAEAEAKKPSVRPAVKRKGASSKSPVRSQRKASK